MDIKEFAPSFLNERMPAPVVGSWAATGTGTSDPIFVATDVYLYKIAYVDEAGNEGPLSASITETIAGGGVDTMVHANMPTISGIPGAVSLNLYRTEGDGSDYYLVASIGGDDGAYTDATADADLGDAYAAPTTIGLSPSKGNCFGGTKYHFMKLSSVLRGGIMLIADMFTPGADMTVKLYGADGDDVTALKAGTYTPASSDQIPFSYASVSADAIGEFNTLDRTDADLAATTLTVAHATDKVESYVIDLDPRYIKTEYLIVATALSGTTANGSMTLIPILKRRVRN